MSAKLHLVPTDDADPPAGKSRPPAREVAANVWWHAVVFSAVCAGLVYVGLCVGIVVAVLQMDDRGPFDVLLSGLALSLALLAGVGIWQRLARPPRPPAPVEPPVVGVYEHHHVHRYED